MTSTKHSKRIARKGVKWISTRYARSYKAKVAFQRIAAMSALMQSMATINAIKSASFAGKVVTVSKSLAIAEAVVHGYSVVNKILGEKIERK